MVFCISYDARRSDDLLRLDLGSKVLYCTGTIMTAGNVKLTSNSHIFPSTPSDGYAFLRKPNYELHLSHYDGTLENVA